MKLLDDIIAEHYPPAQRKKIKGLLEKYSIFEILDNCSRYLKAELELTIKDNSKAPLAIVSATTSNILIGVNSQIAQIQNGKEKSKVKRVVADIAVRMLFSIFRQFPEDTVEIFQIIKGTLSSLAKQRSYDIDDMNSFLDLDGISQMIKSISGQKAAKEITPIKATNTSRLVWTERVHIGILSYELIRRKWLRSEREFWRLFDENDREVKVRWNIRIKCHLAYLLYILKKEDYIRTTTTKGYYKLVQDKSLFNEECLPKDSLKKFASNVRKDPKKYHDIVKSVDEIMTILSLKS